MVKTRRSRPAAPLTQALMIAALSFVLPVSVGVLTGNLSLRGFILISLVTLAAAVVTFVVTSRTQRELQR